jgi:hypothetical protein
MDHSQEYLQEKFKGLPQILQDALSSSDMLAKVEEIGKKYRLLLPQIDDLVSEVGFVIMGIEESGKFIENVGRKLNIPLATATQISYDVNATIFKDIKDYLIEHTTSDGEPEDIDTEKLSGGEENIDSIDRDELLREIEDKKEEPKETNPEHLPEIKPEQEIAQPSDVPPVLIKPIKLEDYLPKNKIDSEENKGVIPNNTQNPKPTYKIDPYREQI